MRIYKKRLQCYAVLVMGLYIIIQLPGLWIYFKEYFLGDLISDSTDIYENRTQMLMELEILLKDVVSQEKSKGCSIPYMDPFSSEARKFDAYVIEPDCSGDEDWVMCHLSECYVKPFILEVMKNVTCTYRDIVYIDDNNYRVGEAVELADDNIYDLNKSDFVRVSCSGIISDYAPNMTWLRSGWQGFKAGYRRLPKVAGLQKSLNVMMLLVDSVSRTTFIRKLPRSYRCLKDELFAVVMDGFNIVGHASDGTMWPILTGRHELEVPDTRRRPGNTKRVDPNLFLFSLLSEYGYRTAYVEDLSYENTFNFRFNGFEGMPADHYTRHLRLDRHRSSLESDYCFGVDSMFQFMVEYSADLFKLGVKAFCVTHTAVHSHDDYNLISVVDHDLMHFLQRFKADGHLENTLLFVMADHGPRCSSVRNTYQGRLEELLPFVSIVIPERLKKVRPDGFLNLKANSKVLTTPFDIHTTVLDALGLKKHRNKYKVPGADLERGMSLLEPIPRSRSCAEAGIVPHLCTCTGWRNVSSDDDVYEKVARSLASFVNRVTNQKRHLCAKRNLLSIKWVRRLGPKADVFGYTTKETILNRYYPRRYYPDENVEIGNEYYHVKAVMGPGKAIFEAFMLYMADEDYFRVTDKDVTRIDKYGDEPKCVTGTYPHLAKYCYCK